MSLAGKRALVTGGAVRIGRAIARRLAEEGADVAIHYRSSEAPARALREELQTEFGIRAPILQADLVSEPACNGLFDAAVRALGGVDVLVNNASTFNKHTLAETTEESLLNELWPNLFAPLFLMRAFAATASGGKIINLLDRRVVSLDTSCVPYLLAKKSLAELTRMAALDLAPGFTVNGVAPGAILPPPGEGASYLKEKGGVVPLERQCTESDIAAAVLFLLENDALTGQVVFVDGGQHLLANPEG